MKKIIGLTIAFMLLIGMTGIGTWAYFSDVETSTGNQMTAGTLNLKTDDVDGVSQTLLATNMAPGDTVGPETITLKIPAVSQGHLVLPYTSGSIQRVLILVTLLSRFTMAARMSPGTT